MLPTRLRHPGPQQGKRWCISFLLGGLLLSGLLWQAQQTQSMHAISPATLEAEAQLLDIDNSQRMPLTLRNPDRSESHEATQQLRILRQCISSNEGLNACLGHLVSTWRRTPSLLVGFLEALRYQERQPGHEGDPGQIVDQIARLLPETRDQTEVYQIWFGLHRHRGEGYYRSFRAMKRLQPRYLSLMLQAEQAARQAQRQTSLGLYEAAATSFLDTMLAKMRKGESIAIEAYNQSHDQKDLARLYLQQGWWAEAERVLYRLAEQEPLDQIVLGLMEQLRRRSVQAQAG